MEGHGLYSGTSVHDAMSYKIIFTVFWYFVDEYMSDTSIVLDTSRESKT